MAYLGETTISGGLAQKVADAQGVGTKIVVPGFDIIVDNIRYHGRSDHDFFQSGNQISIATVSGTYIYEGPVKWYNDRVPKWYTIVPSSAVVLSANETYWIVQISYNSVYEWNAGYISTEETYFTRDLSAGTEFVPQIEPGRSYITYINYTEYGLPQGPPIKLEGITPGKLEQIPWDDIASVDGV